MGLRGKVAIVTGSGGEGSGRAEARRLAAEGRSVVISDIKQDGGGETQRLIQAGGGHAEFFRCDVSVQQEVKALVEFAEQKSMSRSWAVDLAEDLSMIMAWKPSNSPRLLVLP